MADRRRLQLKEFKTEAKDGDPGPCLIAKGYTCAVEDADGERQLQFTISTGSIDRAQDTVNPEGAVNLKSFPKTGVVLWAHDASLPPIAKPLKAWSEDGKVKSIAEFTPPDLDHPLGRGFGSTVYRYFQEKFLKSVSIGFQPLEWEWSEDRDWGIDFGKWELLEFSPVPVPANREAVVDLAHKGLDMRPVLDWAEKCLDGGPTLIVPRELIEEARDGLSEIYGPNPTTSIPAETGSKGAISYRAAHPDGTPVADKDDEWDGPREVAEADVDDLEVMAAWKEDDAENKGDFKLPHHKADGEHAVVWRGVTAAMGALLGARGGVDIPDGDRRGVYDHLARHYRDDFDEDPPEFRETEEGNEKTGPWAVTIEADDKEGLAAALIESVKAIAEDVEGDVDWFEVIGIEQKRGRVISAKNESDLTKARDLIDGVLAQVAAQDEDEDDKAIPPDRLARAIEDLAAGDIDPQSDAVKRIAEAAKTIAEKCQACEPTEDVPGEPNDLDPAHVTQALAEIVKEEADEYWRRNYTGELR